MTESEFVADRVCKELLAPVAEEVALLRRRLAEAEAALEGLKSRRGPPPEEVPVAGLPIVAPPGG